MWFRERRPAVTAAVAVTHRRTSTFKRTEPNASAAHAQRNARRPYDGSAKAGKGISQPRLSRSGARSLIQHPGRPTRGRAITFPCFSAASAGPPASMMMPFGPSA
jgi:hypothetical protein